MKYIIITVLAMTNALNAQTVDDFGNETYTPKYKLKTPYNKLKYPKSVFFGGDSMINGGDVEKLLGKPIKTGKKWKVNDYKKELKEIYGIEIPNNIISFKEINIWLEENGIEL